MEVSMEDRRTLAEQTIRTFLARANRDAEAGVSTPLFADGLRLDSLETAELSVTLEEALGTDPFTEGQIPQTIAEVLEFYRDSAP